MKLKFMILGLKVFKHLRSFQKKHGDVYINVDLNMPEESFTLTIGLPVIVGKGKGIAESIFEIEIDDNIKAKFEHAYYEIARKAKFGIVLLNSHLYEERIKNESETEVTDVVEQDQEKGRTTEGTRGD